MASVLRANLTTAISARLTNLGHVLNPDEIEAIVNDVEAQIAADASATADAQSDLGQFPVDPATTS